MQCLRTTLLAIGLVAAVPLARADAVILLHGLSRGSGSMLRMEAELKKAGYDVLNVSYPSRTADVATLAESAIGGALRDASTRPGRIHFVTHSMGGILVRQYHARHAIPNLGRVVMLGPPNQGSEVVDRLGGWRLFSFINGPAGRELGTGAESTVRRLGPVKFELGVIAADRSINWINSLMIPGRDDGKVSVARTRVEGMKDHIAIHATHPLMMKNTTAIRQTIAFLKNGTFERSTPDLLR